MATREASRGRIMGGPTMPPGLAPLVWVVVLGDFGRSPRMMYHTLSLVEHGFRVHVLAHLATQPGAEFVENVEAGRVALHGIAGTPPWIDRLRPVIVGKCLKALHQALTLLIAMLWTLPRPTLLLLQVPPALPTLLICWLASRVRRSRFVADWHNTACSLMALSLGPRHALVRAASWYERTFSRLPDANLTVTHAMAQLLRDEWLVRSPVAVLHDRPHKRFYPRPHANHAALFARLSPDLARPSLSRGDFLSDLVASAEGDAGRAYQSHFVTAAPAPGQPGAQGHASSKDVVLAVSSTSWTPDEDFSVMFEALDLYDRQQSARASTGRPLPRLAVFVTGRGPMRAEFEERVRGAAWKSVAVRFLWLQPEDCPVLLSAALLGVSLHTSSSGRDLPMKALDMLGSGAPVLSRRFACVDELIRDGENGRLFDTGEELGVLLVSLLTGGGGSDGDGGGGGGGDGDGGGVDVGRFASLQQLRANVQRHPTAPWGTEWAAHALPLLQGVGSYAGTT